MTHTSVMQNSKAAALQAAAATIEILKLSERPDVISFAGGLPDPRTFDMAAIREVSDKVLADEGRSVMNYGPTPGYPQLRSWIAERMRHKEGIEVGSEEILITSGSVEALHLYCGTFLDPGDTVLVEAPSYLVALHIFRCFGVRIIPVPLDAEGLCVDQLQGLLTRLAQEGARVKFLYSIPSFQNPTGLTLSHCRRLELAELVRAHRLPVLEDHAYAELCYDHAPLPSLKSLVPEQVVFLHTFSKIFGPGARLGWACAERKLIDRMALYKIGTDQCSNTITQRIILRYGESGGLERQVAASIPIYRQKRDLLLAAMQQELGNCCHWTVPQGGFFLWVDLPEEMSSNVLLARCLEQEKVAFVAGPPFFVSDGEPFLRLCFSYVPAAQILEGIHRLARVFHNSR
jgi:2-aminoadipate transaminase